jgi:hypothetical protein
VIPAAPTALAVTVPPGSGQANLNWTDDSNNETGFNILCSFDGTTYTQIASVPAGSTHYGDPTLGAAATAYYEVIAFNTAGDSAPSNVVGARTGEVGAWALDDGAGGVAMDSSGNGNAGTLINGPTWSPGMFGDALSFNGTTQYVSCGNAANLNITGALSVGGWFKMNTTGGFNSTGIDKEDSYRIVADTANATSSTWQIMLTDSRGKGNIHLLHSTDSFANGSWHYVVGTYDGAGTANLYVDGKPEGALSWTGSGAPYALYASPNPFEIGRRDMLRYFAGSIDQVTILNRQISAAEIANEYALAKYGIHVQSTLILGDTNCDGVVDVTDLGNLASNYGDASGATWTMGDFSGDGKIDVTDLGDLATNYGSSASPAAAAAAPAPAAQVAIASFTASPIPVSSSSQPADNPLRRKPFISTVAKAIDLLQ